MNQFYHLLLFRLTKIFHMNLSSLASMCKTTSILLSLIYFYLIYFLLIIKGQNGSIGVANAHTAEALDHLNKLTATIRCSAVSFT